MSFFGSISSAQIQNIYHPSIFFSKKRLNFFEKMVKMKSALVFFTPGFFNESSIFIFISINWCKVFESKCIELRSINPPTLYCLIPWSDSVEFWWDQMAASVGYESDCCWFVAHNNPVINCAEVDTQETQNDPRKKCLLNSDHTLCVSGLQFSKECIAFLVSACMKL